MNKAFNQIISILLLIGGLSLIINFKINILGAVIGVDNININPIFGIILIFISVLLFSESLEDSVEEEKSENIGEIVKSHHWIRYHITPDSEPIDKRIDKKTGKSTGLGYLNEPKDFPGNKNTPIQDRIEKLITGKGKILPYIDKDSDKLRTENKGETVNRRNSYSEQFNEPHAAGGGRIIEVLSHISKLKLFSPSTWIKKGRLVHFNQLANGEYIWVIDSDGNFIVANRGEVDEAGLFKGMIHEMYQMPPDLGSGARHKKIDKRKTTLPHSTLARGLDVFGAGEVTIRDGLIERYNADSGHYAKTTVERLGEPHEPDNYVRQSIEAFKLFSKKAGWKEIKGGASYQSRHFNP